MWIGSIRLVVETKDAPDAGTDSLVQATVVRDGTDLREHLSGPSRARA